MHLIIPVRLKFSYNSHKHHGYLKGHFRNDEIQLLGNVKAVIADSRSEGLNILKADIEKWMTPWLSNDGVTIQDFELIYSCDSIEDGRVWASTSVVGFAKF